MTGFFKKIGRGIKHGFNGTVHAGKKVAKGIGHGVVHVGESIGHGFVEIGKTEAEVAKTVYKVGTPIVDVAATVAETTLPIVAALQPELAPELLGASVAIKAVHQSGHALHQAHRHKQLDVYTATNIGAHMAAGVIQGPTGDLILKSERIGHDVRSKQRAGTYDVTSGLLTGLEAVEALSEYKLASLDPEDQKNTDEIKQREQALRRLRAVKSGTQQVDELYKQDRLGYKEAGAVGTMTLADIMVGEQHKLTKDIGKEIKKFKVPGQILDASRKNYEDEQARRQAEITRVYDTPEPVLSIHPEDQPVSRPLHTPCLPVTNVLPTSTNEMHNYMSGVRPQIQPRPQINPIIRPAGMIQPRGLANYRQMNPMARQMRSAVM